MTNCSKCGKQFKTGDVTDLMAAMSGSIMGDEQTESYFYCEECGVYTVYTYWDYFSGEESQSVHGPVDKAKGDAQVALIRRCSEPWNKKCRCEAHQEFFGNSLD